MTFTGWVCCTQERRAWKGIINVIETKSAVTPSLFAKQLCQCRCCVLQSKFPPSPSCPALLLICLGLALSGQGEGKKGPKIQAIICKSSKPSYLAS